MKIATLIFVELTSYVLALLLTLFVRYGTTLNNNLVYSHLSLFLILIPVWLFFFYIEGLYSLKTLELKKINQTLIRGTLLSTISSMILFYYLPQKYFGLTPKTNLLLFSAIYFILVQRLRMSLFSFFSKYSKKKIKLETSDENFKIIKKAIIDRPYLGYTLNQDQPDILVFDHNSEDLFKNLLNGTSIIPATKFYENITGKVSLSMLTDSWFLSHCGEGASRPYTYLKNISDKLLALIVLLTSLPVFIIILPFLVFEHGLSFIYSQKRVGKNNKVFTIYKLRSMVKNAEANGAIWSSENDHRITKFGKILRKLRIDEIPQVINVLRGEMSFVGPRPERPEIIEDKLSDIPFYNLRHLTLPGITGWAQIHYKYGNTKDDAINKLEYDLYYLKNRSFFFDVEIILKTIKSIISISGK